MADTSPMPSVLIDAAELARMLSVSKPTIWRLKSANALPPALALTKQCIRFKRDDVEAWLAAVCPSANAQQPRDNGGAE